MSAGEELGLVWVLSALCIGLLWHAAQLRLDLGRERRRVTLRRRRKLGAIWKGGGR